MQFLKVAEIQVCYRVKTWCPYLEGRCNVFQTTYSYYILLFQFFYRTRTRCYSSIWTIVTDIDFGYSAPRCHYESVYSCPFWTKINGRRRGVRCWTVTKYPLNFRVPFNGNNWWKWLASSNKCNVCFRCWRYHFCIWIGVWITFIRVWTRTSQGRNNQNDNDQQSCKFKPGNSIGESHNRSPGIVSFEIL